MPNFRIPLGDRIVELTDFLKANLAWLFDALRWFFRAYYDLMEKALTQPNFYIVAGVLVLLAFALKNWRVALASAAGIALIVGLDQWDNTMETLALVFVAASTAIFVSVPLGIWAARSNRVSRGMKPVLDFMQTMPAFVYLIPAILFFRVGVVPGIVATIIFAMAPGVRLTELGIRSVDKEVIEAGYSFGAAPRKVLRQIQLPLALPSISAGVNQVIMLSLSMVVIAGMVGAGGLGNEVVMALQRVDIGHGFEAGLAVVLVAVYLDRLTNSLGSGQVKQRLSSWFPTSRNRTNVVQNPSAGRA